jgi:hypothetical protein
MSNNSSNTSSQTIFQQKRANIERASDSNSENAGQLALLDYLEQLLPTVDEIELKIPLQGKLDFAILQECKFDNIRGIILEPGQVTHITNLPRTITRLHVGNNLLEDLADLPDALIEFDARSNGFRRLDLSYLSHLKSVQLSNNELQEVRFPQSVETVNCENNHLKELDLLGLDHLQTLHCSGNPLLVIRNAASQTQIHMVNSPVVEIQKEKGESRSSKSSKSSSTFESRIDVDVQDAFQKYMSKKSQYETKLRAVLQRNAESMNGSKMKRKDRREGLRQLRMHAPCIKCSRPVTTVFSNRDRIYRAVCGDRVHPCELNVEIHAGMYQDLVFGLEIVREMLVESTQRMIELKMDSVFSYKPEKQVLAESEKQKAEYELDKSIFEESLKEYEDLQMSEETMAKIAELQKEIFAIDAQIQQILQHDSNDSAVLSSALSNHDQLLRDAMQIHVNELVPKRRELQRTMYEWMEMEKLNDTIDTNKSQFRLIEKHSRLIKRDYVLEDGKVVKYTW